MILMGTRRAKTDRRASHVAQPAVRRGFSSRLRRVVRGPTVAARMPVSDRTPWWWNLPLPGAGLIVSGRVALGLAAALPALFMLTLALVAALLATAEVPRAWSAAASPP